MCSHKRMSEFSISRNYQRRQCYVSTQKWLSSQGLVIAGYWDKVAGVNLLHLVALWREAQLDGETLSEQHPDAAEYFQIRVMSSGDQAHLQDILPEFDGCPHIKIWCMGDKINLQPNFNG